MTIFELIDIYEARIAALSGYLRALHGNRLCDGSAIARRVRRRLIAVLEDMIAQDREDLVSERRYLAHTTEAERQEDGLETLNDDDFVDNWNGYHLLDRTMVHADGRRAYDFHARLWWPIRGRFPLFVPVTSDELGELTPTLRRIEQGLGIRFIIERICFNEEAAVSVLARAPLGAYGIARLAGGPPS